MRLSYGLLTQFARAGDVHAINLLSDWEKHGDPESPTMKVEAHFQGRVDDTGTLISGPGYFLATPKKDDLSLPKRTATLLGMPAVRERSGTLTGIPAALAPMGSGYESVIITDEDGDPDGDE